MTTKRQWDRVRVEQLAEVIMQHLAPFCERITVAGSVRRRQDSVGDLELLAVPKTVKAEQAGLFGDSRVSEESLLDAEVARLLKMGTFRPRPNKDGNTSVGPLNKLLIWTPAGLPVDLFTTTVDNWGLSMLVRTGPKEYNMRVMARLRALHLKGHAYGGIEDQDGIQHSCPHEADVYRWLGWLYVPPEMRQ